MEFSYSVSYKFTDKVIQKCGSISLIFMNDFFVSRKENNIELEKCNIDL